MTAALVVAALACVGAACSDEGSVFRVEVGDCMERPPEGEVEGIDLVDCDREHLGEIVGTVVHEGREFPGGPALSAEAFERCRPELEAYVDDPELAADYGIVPLSPTQESWEAEIADRESLCIAVPIDLVPYSGSLRDLAVAGTTVTSGPTTTV